MNIRDARIPKNPYLGYDAREAVRSALACMECPTPAPCTTLCSQGVNIPKVMYWVGMAACEGLVLSRWLLNEEEIETARIVDQICDSYN